MAALTAPRNTRKLPGAVSNQYGPLGLAAGTKLYQGAILCTDANGRVVQGQALTGLTCFGMANLYPEASLNVLDNTSGAADALYTFGTSGVFYWDNATGADAITRANIGQDCYIVDDHTVALYDASLGAGQPSRSFAGRIVDYQPGLVQPSEQGVVGVYMDPSLRPNPFGLYPRFTATIPIDLPTLANAQTYVVVTPGYACRVLSAQFTVRKPATTAAKAATVTVAIGAAGGPYTNVTGGAIALTTANCTPAGAKVAATAITGANLVTAAQEVALAISSVTAFGEGDGEVTVVFG